MIKTPQNKSIVLIALGATMIIAALAGKWEFTYAIVVGLFAQMPPGDNVLPEVIPDKHKKL